MLHACTLVHLHRFVGFDSMVSVSTGQCCSPPCIGLWGLILFLLDSACVYYSCSPPRFVGFHSVSTGQCVSCSPPRFVGFDYSMVSVSIGQL